MLNQIYKYKLNLKKKSYDVIFKLTEIDQSFL